MYERPSSRSTWAKFQALLTICWLSLVIGLSPEAGAFTAMAISCRSNRTDAEYGAVLSTYSRFGLLPWTACPARLFAVSKIENSPALVSAAVDFRRDQ